MFNSWRGAVCFLFIYGGIMAALAGSAFQETPANYGGALFFSLLCIKACSLMIVIAIAYARKQ